MAASSRPPANVAAPLRSQVALVTGSSQGIGRAIAYAFASAGATVVLNGRDRGRLEEAAAGMRDVTVVEADLATERGCEVLIQQALEACGKIDVLVNNAGRSFNKPSIDLSTQEWQLNIDLNLTAPFICSKLAARAMLEQGSGSIINIASIAAFTTPAERAGYASAKAGLLALTKVMATELAPTVRVNAVAPGYVATEEWTKRVASGVIDSDAVARETPMGRAGYPEEVADLVLYLASSRSSFITGAVHVIDGGFLSSGKSF